MNKNKSPQVQFDPDKLAAFFKAIDVDEPFRQFGIETELQKFAFTYRQQFNRPDMAELPRKRLRQYLRASQKKRALRQALGPAVQHEIIVAALLRENPGTITADASAVIAEHQISLSQLDEDEKCHEADIGFLLAESGSDYRKKRVTKLAVEPVLQLLKKRRITPSRELPLSRIAHALFDLFDIAARDRLSGAAVTGAWRKLNRQ
jgi:hypothetical protein